MEYIIYTVVHSGSVQYSYNNPLMHEEFIKKFTNWSKNHEQILVMALVGSYARGEAKPDSDVDLVIITNQPEKFLKDDSWIKEFGEVKKQADEDYQLAQGKRVFYKNGIEAEYGITTLEWAKTDPVYSGTKRVITDGAKILYDKNGLLEKLLKALH